MQETQSLFNEGLGREGARRCLLFSLWIKNFVGGIFLDVFFSFCIYLIVDINAVIFSAEVLEIWFKIL